MNYKNLNYEDPNDIRKAILMLSCCTASSGGGTPAALAAASVAGGDLLTIVDISEASAADRNKSITMANLEGYLINGSGSGNVLFNTSSTFDGVNGFDYYTGTHTLSLGGVIPSTSPSSNVFLQFNSNMSDINIRMYNNARNTATHSGISTHHFGGYPNSIIAGKLYSYDSSNGQRNIFKWYANGTVLMANPPLASASLGLLSLGSGPFDGATSGYFTGSSNGTFIAINSASGYSGDWLRFKKFNSDIIRIENSGSMTISNGYVNANGAIINGSNMLYLSSTSNGVLKYVSANYFNFDAVTYLGVGVSSGATAKLHIQDDGVHDGLRVQNTAGNNLFSVKSGGGLEVGHPTVTYRYLSITWGSVHGNSTSDELGLYATGAATAGIILRAPSHANANKIEVRTLGFSINEGSYTASDASALLELNSTTRGFKPPVMTGTQIEAISSPSTGLLAYATAAGSGDVTTSGWWGYNGSNWIQLG